MWVIERIHWNAEGRVEQVLWRELASPHPQTRPMGQAVQASVEAVVAVIHSGGAVHLATSDGQVGPLVRVVPGRSASIQLVPDVPSAAKLSEMPTF